LPARKKKKRKKKKEKVSDHHHEGLLTPTIPILIPTTLNPSTIVRHHFPPPFVVYSATTEGIGPGF